MFRDFRWGQGFVALAARFKDVGVVEFMIESYIAKIFLV